MTPDEAGQMSRLVRQWLAKADEDMAVAERLFKEEMPFLNATTFHAQQAAEKYLKAYLVHRQIEFPKTHSIQLLLELAAQDDPALSERLKEAKKLTPYAIEARYPADHGELTAAEAEEAVKLAATVRHTVKEKLGGSV